MQPYEQVKYFQNMNLFILKLKGALRFTCAQYFDKALNNIDLTKSEDIIFDLTESKFIDSTIMGGMAKFILQESTQQKLKNKPTIVYKTDDIKLMFDKIGFDKFFNFTNEDQRLNINQNELISFTEIKPDVKKLKESIRIAHQILSELHPDDPAYKEVVQALKDK